MTNRTGVGGVKIADPVAVRDKSRAPRSGDFVRQSPGVQGAAAIGRPLHAPCASGNMWLSS
ncbi:hypothetical protein BE964_24280 [Escherichia coli]|nr:hypothetical protein BE964_24280 [Escherichia coli]AQV60313.1 hypothetical protein BE941_21370 [Escherichia coli]AQV76759.1 hypothetical protein BE932_28075 [Escherichia coli]AQV87143.1 hypothetical protein BE940_28155 [Escherichia coli]AQW04559.1 hypothetical protein BE939_18805 [Escherichia coli]